MIIKLAIAVKNPLRIRHNDIGADASHLLAPLLIGLGEAGPFFAGPVFAVHVNQRLGADQPGKPNQRTVADNAVIDHVVAAEKSVKRGKCRMNDGVQMLGGNGGKGNNPHPFIFILHVFDEM